MLNPEKIVDRIFELENFLENFPTSPMANAVRGELNHLISLL